MTSIEEQNAALLTEGEDSLLTCEEHGITRRWGDLDSASQLMVLNGWDLDGRCVLAGAKPQKG